MNIYLAKQGLYKKLDVLRPRLLSNTAMTRFHSDEYIDFLKYVTPDNMSDHKEKLQRFGLGEANPIFDGLFEYVQLYTSGSIAGAQRLNNKMCNTAINWSGGMHNAKPSEASGFGYVNDCVLSILELLKNHDRVLYVDLDIYHGDAVEAAFYNNKRVMTVDFHKDGNIFPGTGDVDDIGVGEGKGYAVNVPLKEGIDDKTYLSMFKTIVGKAMALFQPNAIVVCSGANSLSKERLGCFNLSTKGHGECIRVLRDANLPTLLLGGGGTNLCNTARCWTYETAVAVGEDIKDDMPFSEVYDYFAPTFKLHDSVSNMENLNAKSYLDEINSKIFDNLQSYVATAVPIEKMQVEESLPAPDKVAKSDTVPSSGAKAAASAAKS